MKECLQLLVKKLQHLQHGLDSELCLEKFIYNRFINACQKVFTCQYTCFKPLDILAGFINNLRSSIVTSQKANPFKIFFTDWCNHKYSGTPQSNWFQSRPSYNQDKSKKKRCFVCDKKSCWSTKHIKDEQDKARKYFKKRLNQSFDKCANHYIVNYEKIETESENSLDN